MSYGRDRDAHTRGPGAIAAIDRRGTKRARRARGAVMSARRDAQLAGLTYGSRGGLGVINNMDSMSQSARRPTIRGGGVIEGPPPAPSITGQVIPPWSPAPPKPRVNGPSSSVFGARAGAAVQQPRINSVTVDPTYPGTTPPKGPRNDPDRVVRPPMPLPPPLPTPPKTTTVIVTGGGSGGGIVTGGKTGSVPGGIQVGPPIPDFEAPNNRTRNLLIGAALLGGAYLLLRHKDGDS